MQKVSLDCLLRMKPSAKTLAAESCIMFVNNKTLSWLEQRQLEEQKRLLRMASNSAKKYFVRKTKVDCKKLKEVAMNEQIAKREQLGREKIRK